MALSGSQFLPLTLPSSIALLAALLVLIASFEARLVDYTYRYILLIMVTISVVSLSTLAGAEPNAGQRLYLQYCSACHGAEGKGDGVVSGLMQPKPPDLTLLARRNGGIFPTVAVIDTIDGRSSLRAHGDPDMPVWGAILRSDAGDAKNPDQVVYSVVAQITDYLRAMQAK